MKVMLAIFFLLISVSAQASWFQEYCSNGEGTIQIAEGHDKNEIQLTRRIFVRGRTYDTRILSPNFETSYTNVVVLEREQKLHCPPGEQMGITTYRIVESAKVRITKANGTSFSDKVIGVTPDRKAIESYVICETNGDSESFCK